MVSDMADAVKLADFILGRKNVDTFLKEFDGKYSEEFDPLNHFERIGVVNQTTMLASDTQGIADFLKQVMIEKYQLSEHEIQDRFADTRDTLCYATNDNQSAVYGLLQQKADLAIVVGGYNSSNTSHLVELCEEKLPTYFIDGYQRIISNNSIEHFNFHEKKQLITDAFLPVKRPLDILMTSGASCPDAEVEKVIHQLAAVLGLEASLSKLEATFEP